MPKANKSVPGRAKQEPVSSPPAVLEAEPTSDLFVRVAAILEQARGNVVRAVNSNMVLAYWLIGREIVQEIQRCKDRAAYGRQVLADLARKLTARHGEGFSETSLRYFRAFYLSYAERSMEIRHPAVDELLPGSGDSGIQRPSGAESVSLPPEATKHAIGRPAGDRLNGPDPLSAIQRPMGAELLAPAKCYPAGSKSLTAFSPQLSWSHYRALMRVDKPAAREFCEREAIAGAWDGSAPGVVKR